MAEIQVDRLFTDIVPRIDRRAMDRTNREIARFEANVGRFQNVSGQAAGSLRGVGAAAGNLGGSIGSLALRFAGPAALAAGIVTATKASIEFESKMAEVRKVVDGLEDPEAFKRMGDDIVALSNRIPIASEGVADLVAAAGQAGIAREELLGFAEDAGKIGVAFDISAEQAGDAVAKLRTGLGLSQPQVNALAGTINNLSNNMASSAPEVLKVVQEVGALGTVAGLAGEQTAALGSAMIAAGAKADVAKTATKGLFLSLTQGDATPKKTQEAFEALGLTVGDVAARMQEDSESTIIDVFERINALAPDVKAAITTQIFGRESVGAIGPLAANMDLLKDAFAAANDEVAAATSVQDEFDSKSNTTANRLQLLRNRLENAVATIGDQLKPALDGILALLDTDEARDFGTRALQNLADGVRFTTELLTGLLTTLRDVGAALEPLVSGFQKGAGEADAITGALGGVMDALAGVGAAISALLGDGSGALEALGEVAGTVLTGTVLSALELVEDGLRIVATLADDLRQAFSAFGDGRIANGFVAIGRTIRDALLEPLRAVVRQVVDLADAVGGSGTVPDAVRAFASGGTVERDRVAAGVTRGLRAADEEREAERSRELAAGRGARGFQFLGIERRRDTSTVASPELLAAVGAGRVGGRRRGGGGRGARRRETAGQALIESRISERVAAAERLALARGEDERAAGRAARAEVEAFAKNRQFAALGISPQELTALGRRGGAGVGPGDRGAVNITVVKVEAGAIAQLNVSGTFTGSPAQIGRSLMGTVIDQVVHATQLRTGVQVQ